MDDNMIKNIEIVRSIPFFAAYSNLIQEKIAERLSFNQCKAGDVIIHEGEEGNNLFVIRSGLVRVERNGRELAALHKGEFFGELSLVTSEMCVADVIAVEDTELVVLSKIDFLSLVKEGLFQDEKSKEELFKRIRENYMKGF